GAGNFRLPHHQGWCRIEWLLHRSGAATPQRAIASCDEWQAVFITRPVGVVRQLEFLFHSVPALAFLRLLLDLGRGLLHQRQDILGVLLGAEAAVGLARITALTIPAAQAQQPTPPAPPHAEAGRSGIPQRTPINPSLRMLSRAASCSANTVPGDQLGGGSYDCTLRECDCYFAGIPAGSCGKPQFRRGPGLRGWQALRVQLF